MTAASPWRRIGLFYQPSVHTSLTKFRVYYGRILYWFLGLVAIAILAGIPAMFFIVYLFEPAELRNKEWAAFIHTRVFSALIIQMIGSLFSIAIVSPVAYRLRRDEREFKEVKPLTRI